MPTNLTILEAINIPDDSTTDIAGKGFTCTGLCRSSEGGWWVGRFWQSIAGDVTGTPGVVRLSNDFSAVLQEIDLSVYGAGASTQGVALDTTDNTLWITTLNYLRHHEEDGTRLSSLEIDTSATLSPNGVCYDSDNDILYASSILGLFASFDPNSRTLIASLATCPGNLDHLCMADGKVWGCVGANGENGVIWEYDPALDTWTELYTLIGADANEGLWTEDGILYVANDGYYHSPDGTDPELNRILKYRYRDPDPEPPAPTTNKRSQAHVARILAASL